MGKIVTPTYRVEYRDQTGWQSAAWTGGKPSDANAERWRVSMNESYKPNGANAHIPQALKFIPHTSHVRIVRQSDNKIVATATMPMFEVV